MLDVDTMMILLCAFSKGEVQCLERVFLQHIYATAHWQSNVHGPWRVVLERITALVNFWTIKRKN